MIVLIKKSFLTVLKQFQACLKIFKTGRKKFEGINNKQQREEGN